ncbi:DUF2884 family protein [Dyella japonica]|uniref:DUF2884 family protein n=1 Tax=Dyella japonica DSM 16301 TaxID=1440762 RepID=A0A0G9H4X1_9GAMM|nr:DUF2884 family protein [Dyella japonica]KLD62747.1 hypothetical protein Y882_14915 [Dyella japonica DSM 16301]
MRTTMMACALAAGLALGGAAHAHDLEVHDGHCGYSTAYDVQVMPSGIGFHRDDGKPADVFMHDGRLRVDGRDVAVSNEDAARLRDYEQQVRLLLPEVAGIAREGVNIGFAAMRTVLLTFAENDDERRRMVGRLDENHRLALARVDDGLGKGVWKSNDMEEVVEKSVENSVSDLVSKVAGEAVSAALSGDQSKVAALEARAESLDKSIDREVNKRADELDKHADALCPKLSSLDTLQHQFQFRLQDGSRLQLLAYDKEHNKKLTTATDSARAGGGESAH